MLPEGDQPRHRTVQAAGDLGEALFFTDGHVVPFIDSFGRKQAGQELREDAFPGLHAQAYNLQAQVIAKLIHRQPRQSIGIPEDHPAGIVKSKGLPAIPGAGQAAAEQFPIDGFLGIPGQNAHQDFRLAVEESPGNKATGAVDYIHKAAVGAAFVYPGNLVVINPAFAPAELPLFSPPQAHLPQFHMDSFLRAQLTDTFPHVIMY